MNGKRDRRQQECKYVKPPQKGKDWWDKAEILSKFLAAILIVLLGFWGNHYLQTKQKEDNNLKLYTQLLSNKETAENTLRKDMFSKILDSFLTTNKNDKSVKHETLPRIREMRLNLELLSRNFHESLDIKPLFKHLLMEIVRPRLKLTKLLHELQNCTSNASDSSCDQVKIQRIAKEAETLTNGEITARHITDSKFSDSLEEVKRLSKRYDGELDLLINVSKRVTRKQREILGEVAGELTLEINLLGEEANRVCTEYSPTDFIPQDGECENRDHQTGKDEPGKVEGVMNDGVLSFKDAVIEADGKNTAKSWVLSKLSTKDARDKDADSNRYFAMRVRYVYPRWKQVYVEILTCPVKGDEKMSEEICAKRCDSDPKNNNKADFWLEYFDFPLVDNTFINSKQRYSVILDGFEKDKEDNDAKVKITLLYYPAAYSGMKEKSFYNNQLMRGLLKQDLFNEEQE